MVNRNIVDDGSWYSDRDFISNLVRNNVSLYGLRTGELSGFNNGFVSSLSDGSLLELNLHSLLVDGGSGYVLLVVYVSWNVDSLRTRSTLINGVSSDGVPVNDSVLLLVPVELETLFLLDGLNVGLGDIYIPWDGVVPGGGIILHLSFSHDRLEVTSDRF